MAESKKKKTVKKTEAGTKKTPSKTPAKSAPKTATKKTKKPAAVSSSKAVTSPKVESAVTKKVAPKKSPTVKTAQSTPAAKKTKKVVSRKKPTHFTKDLLPETTPSKDAPLDTSLFTMIVAIFIVALVVFGGFIYARKARMMESPAPFPREEIQPQRIRVSSSVLLSPDVITALETIVTQITIGPDEVLQNVRSIGDAQTETVFSPDAQTGDFVFEFKSASILYRPSTKQVIKTASPATV